MVPVNQPRLDGRERSLLIECIETGWISSEGPFVSEFEKGVASRVHRAHGVAVCNGTAAIDAAIEALGIGPGDEVIVPAFTIISCLLQIVRAGAVPVLIDSDPITWNMNVALIEGRITSRTKAIMVVHIYGLPVDIDPVLDLAEKHGIAVIEDAAEMLGQTHRGRPCGSFGTISTFSFYPNKHVTTGEGGMIVTNDSSLADECRSLRNLCFQPHKRFVHERLGWNLRMTNLQAAVGLAQLERLDEFQAHKRRMGALYTGLLQDVPQLQLPVVETEYAKNAYWVFGVVLNDGVPFDAEEAMRRLAADGVGTRPFFCPMHLQPVLQRKGLFEGDAYPVAERLYRRGFYVPSGMAITDTEIEIVSESLRKLFA